MSKETCQAQCIQTVQIMKLSKTKIKTMFLQFYSSTVLQQSDLLMSVCSVGSKTLSRIDDRRLSVDARYLQLSGGRVVMSVWWAWHVVARCFFFRPENFLKVLIGKRKAVKRQGRCRVETLAPSDTPVTLVKLSGMAIFASGIC